MPAQRATLALFAAVALSLAACGGGKAQGAGSGVAATVNGKEITLSEVDRLVNQQTQGQQLSTTQQAAACSGYRRGASVLRWILRPRGD